MNKKITGRFKSQLSQLSALRDFVRSSSIEGFPEQNNTDLELIILAVNEAFTNIVIHAYNNQPDHEIKIETEITKESIIIELADKGSVFEIESVPKPDLSGVRENGYGVYIIKTVMEQMTYSKKTTPSGWNKLKLIKKL